LIFLVIALLLVVVRSQFIRVLLLRMLFVLIL
jgi:hypothetical protein